MVIAGLKNGRTVAAGRQKVHLDEEDIGDANQGWQVILLLWQLALSHGLELAVMDGKVRPEITAIGKRRDERRQRSNSS